MEGRADARAKRSSAPRTNSRPSRRTSASQEQNLKTQQLRIAQERASLSSAKYDLSRVRIESPINGIVTRRNIEEGETAVTGTMNNPGTGPADDRRHVGDRGRGRGRRDRHPDRQARADRQGDDRRHAGQDLHREGDRDRQQPDPGGRPGGGAQATNFKVVLTLDGEIPDVRPGFTCTAEITTATRTDVIAVPIQATTVREMVVDDKGEIVREPVDAGPGPPSGDRRPAELKPGQSRKELEGVFLVRDGKVLFEPVKTGIAGEQVLRGALGAQGRRTRWSSALSARCASCATGPLVKADARATVDHDEHDAVRHARADGRPAQRMNQFLESAGIALQAIWSNKLRSFLTVLGNIVAVTSIIAVVSLIQGMNAYVTNAIVTDVGADNFNIQRNPIVRTQADEERVRSNPRDHDRRRGRGPQVRRPHPGGRDAGQLADEDHLSRTRRSNSVQVQGVSREYISFSTFNAERGRPISPDRGGPRTAGDDPRLPDGRAAVRPGRPDRQVDSHRQLRSSASSASARRRDRSSESRRTSSRSFRSAYSRRCSARA